MVMIQAAATPVRSYRDISVVALLQFVLAQRQEPDRAGS